MGCFKDGNLFGHGREFNTNGDVYEGQWDEGTYHGSGKQMMNGKGFYIGKFNFGLH